MASKDSIFNFSNTLLLTTEFYPDTITGGGQYARNLFDSFNFETLTGGHRGKLNLRNINQIWMPAPEGRPLRFLLLYPLFVLRSIIFILRRRPELIVVASKVYDALPAVLTKRKFILVLHDAYPWQIGYVSKPIATIAVKGAARVVTPTYATFSSLPIKLRRAIKSKLHVIPNSVNIDEFSKVSYKEARSRLGGMLNIRGVTKILLYAGYISKSKGIHLLLEAFSKYVVKEGKKDVMLILVGNLVDKEVVKELPPRAVYFGVVSEQELISLYKACDVFINPSLLAEGQGRTLIEALAAAKHIIASDNPAFIETAREAGCYFKRGDADDFYLKLKDVLKKIDAGARENTSAKNIAQRYSLPAFKESWSRLLEKVLGDLK